MIGKEKVYFSLLIIVISFFLQLTFMIAATYNFAVLKLMGRGTKFWSPVEISIFLTARL